MSLQERQKKELEMLNKEIAEVQFEIQDTGLTESLAMASEELMEARKQCFIDPETYFKILDEQE